jgi:hypothetical protein
MAMVLVVVAAEVAVVCGCCHANHWHLTSPTDDHNCKRQRRHSHVSVTHSWHACSCVGLINPTTCLSVALARLHALL